MSDQHAHPSPLAVALEKYDKLAGHVGGCTDGGCVIVRPKGMHTNGGCKCATDKYKAMRMMSAGQALADEVRVALGPGKTDQSKAGTVP